MKQIIEALEFLEMVLQMLKEKHLFKFDYDALKGKVEQALTRAKELDEPCVWTSCDGDGEPPYDTQCGRVCGWEEGTPDFCANCGRKVKYEDR